MAAPRGAGGLARCLAAAALLAASCGSPATDPRSSPLPETSPSATTAPTPAVVAHWEDGGSLRLGRELPHAVRVGIDGVLVVGNDNDGCVAESSIITETWRPGGAWSSEVTLERPRADFAAVTLADGRVLLTGGVESDTPGEDEFVEDSSHHSIAATYIYTPASDPRAASWTPAAGLGTPRTAPIAATLADGRVLVAGGYFLGLSGTGVDLDAGAGASAVLAAYRPRYPASGPAVPGPVLANDVDPTIVPGIATAELYDPAIDTWTATGPMRYARYGAPAVTLADGRVLIVGSGGYDPYGARWNYTVIDGAAEVESTAELYDPVTGRFSVTGPLPADWSPLGITGAPLFESLSTGALLALDDGGALLVGRSELLDEGENGGWIRTLRFDPASEDWTVIDETLMEQGHVSYQPLVGRLGDGRILVAGGWSDPYVDHEGPPLDTAQLYDPVSDTWTRLPAMPEPRAGGAAVSLADGSVLLVGGVNGSEHSSGCDPEEPAATGLASTVRFVPGS